MSRLYFARLQVYLFDFATSGTSASEQVRYLSDPPLCVPRISQVCTDILLRFSLYLTFLWYRLCYISNSWMSMCVLSTMLIENAWIISSGHFPSLVSVSASLSPSLSSPVSPFFSLPYFFVIVDLRVLVEPSALIDCLSVKRYCSERLFNFQVSNPCFINAKTGLREPGLGDRRMCV